MWFFVLCIDQSVGPYVNRLSVNRYTADTQRLQLIGRSMPGCYIALISPTEHRHSTDVSSTLVLHVVHTSVDCIKFWMFRDFSLSKCLLSMKFHRDAKISWKLFASFSRLSVPWLEFALAFVPKGAVFPQTNYSGLSFSFATWLCYLKTIRNRTLFCLNRNTCNFGGNGPL